MAPGKEPIHLMLFPNQEEINQGYSVSFSNLTGKKVHQTTNTNRCIGSSHGWLVLLDQSADPCLFNPVSGHRISLPPKQTFPHMISVSGSHEYGFDVEYSYGVLKSRVSRSITAQELQNFLVLKAILSSDPSDCNKNNCLVMAIYGWEAKIAIYEFGDRVWTDLEGKSWPYCDIMCHNNQLFALSKTGSVELWDLHGTCRVKIMDFQPSFYPQSLTENMRKYYDTERFSSRRYLVESCGDLLLVVRYIGEFVGEDNVALCDGGSYKTLEFVVYKLNFVRQKWEEVESLGDRALFLGLNHSMSISAAAGQCLSKIKCNRNSFYFTDDYWERRNEDYLYGGHDVGVFSLNDRSVEPIKNLDLLQRIDRPPFWVFPTRDK